MATRRSALIKVYECEDHAAAFLRGTIFANTLAYFRKLEEQNIRRDPQEGSITLPLTEGFRMTLSPAGRPEQQLLEFGQSDLAEAPTLRPSLFDDINIFCMSFAVIVSENTDKHTIIIPPKSADFGSHCVLIHEPNEFIQRTKKAVDRVGHEMGCKPVEYYDPKIGIYTDLTLTKPEAIFTKRNNYKDEQEYRICIIRDIVTPTPLKLEIGPIHDIAQTIRLPDRPPIV